MEEKILTIISENIDRIRGDVSVDQLSKRAGIPLSTLNNIRQGRGNDIRVQTLYKIANALSCKLDDLLPTAQHVNDISFKPVSNISLDK
jgi:DNA-binding Xre family transcriptional regulator